MKKGVILAIESLDLNISLQQKKFQHNKLTELAFTMLTNRGLALMNKADIPKTRGSSFVKSI